MQYRISSIIVWCCVLENAPAYLLELFLSTSACSGNRSLSSASRGGFVVTLARIENIQKTVGLFLLEIISTLTSVLCSGNFLPLFIAFSGLFSISEPCLGSPKHSYLM